MLSSSSRSILFMICFVYGSYAQNAFSNGLLPLKKLGNKTYYFCDTFQTTMLNAVLICNELGMQLVKVPNKEVNDFVFDVIHKQNKKPKVPSYWSSGMDLINMRSWFWLASPQQFTYTNWAKNQPDFLHERCLELRGRDSGWNDIDCSKQKFYFICESRDDNDQCTSDSDSKYSFYLGTEKVPFETAITKCEERGQMLVTIQSKGKQQAIDKFLKKYDIQHKMWTSGNRLADKITWRWLSGEKSDYSFWAPGEPNNYGGIEECMEMSNLVYANAVWNDVKCDDNYFYFCESKTSE